MTMISGVYRCDECYARANCPPLKSTSWPADPDSLLCIKCTEKKLERELKASDLVPDCMWNDFTILHDKRLKTVLRKHSALNNRKDVIHVLEIIRANPTPKNLKLCMEILTKINNHLLEIKKIVDEDKEFFQ